MAGSIITSIGFQRSGKTALLVYIAYYFYMQGIPVYTNMNGTPFMQIDKLTDLPIDKKPIVLLLDELHFFLNARNFKAQADYIFFLNTICKRNILFLNSTIDTDMIDKNLRKQINYLIMCKKVNNNFHYRWINCQFNIIEDLVLPANVLFNKIGNKFDTNDIPKLFKFNMDAFIKSHY